MKKSSQAIDDHYVISPQKPICVYFIDSLPTTVGNLNYGNAFCIDLLPKGQCFNKEAWFHVVN
jgi:hypothetical protein